LNLFAALQVATDHIHSSTTELKRKEEFVQFMEQVISETESDRELHIILDSYCVYKKCDDWLAEHPNVHFHYASTSANWLNLAEMWFGIMSRKALREANSAGIETLRQAIETFTAAYTPTAKPFKWRKLKVRMQLRDTIVNLYD
jgi:hypothetical protein